MGTNGGRDLSQHRQRPWRYYSWRYYSWRYYSER
jgi:hypothetical protein